MKTVRIVYPGVVEKAIYAVGCYVVIGTLVVIGKKIYDKKVNQDDVVEGVYPWGTGSETSETVE